MAAVDIAILWEEVPIALGIAIFILDFAYTVSSL